MKKMKSSEQLIDNCKYLLYVAFEDCDDRINWLLSNYGFSKIELCEKAELEDIQNDLLLKVNKEKPLIYLSENKPAWCCRDCEYQECLYYGVCLKEAQFWGD